MGYGNGKSKKDAHDAAVVFSVTAQRKEKERSPWSRRAAGGRATNGAKLSNSN